MTVSSSSELNSKKYIESNSCSANLLLLVERKVRMADEETKGLKFECIN